MSFCLANAVDAEAVEGVVVAVDAEVEAHACCEICSYICITEFNGDDLCTVNRLEKPLVVIVHSAE